MKNTLFFHENIYFLLGLGNYFFQIKAYENARNSIGYKAFGYGITKTGKFTMQTLSIRAGSRTACNIRLRTYVIFFC